MKPSNVLVMTVFRPLNPPTFYYPIDCLWTIKTQEKEENVFEGEKKGGKKVVGGR